VKWSWGSYKILGCAIARYVLRRTPSSAVNFLRSNSASAPGAPSGIIKTSYRNVEVKIKKIKKQKNLNSSHSSDGKYFFTALIFFGTKKLKSDVSMLPRLTRSCIYHSCDSNFNWAF
jgi:hypothetical protein